MRYLAAHSITEDWRKLWDSNSKYITAFVLALAVDTISTIHFMTLTGPEQEFHPVVRMAAYAYGPILGPILAALYKVISAMIVVLYWRKLAAPLFTTATVFYLLAGLYNYFAVKLYLEGVMPWLPF